MRAMLNMHALALGLLTLAQVGRLQTSTLSNNSSKDEGTTLHEVAIKQRISELLHFLLPLPQDVFTDLVTQTARRYIPVYAESPVCRNHSNYMLNSFLGGDLWAVKMVDAGSKLTSGALDGHLQDLGNYDQCVNIEEPSGMFKGQHCVVETTGFFPQEILALPPRTDHETRMDVVFSVCVPSTCAEEDVDTHMDFILASINASVNRDEFHLCRNLSGIHCSTADKTPFRIKDFIALSFVGMLGLLLACGTFFGSKSGVLSLLSLRSIVQELTNTKPHGSEISCLTGIRVIFTFIVINTHRVFNTMGLPTQRYLTIQQKIGTVSMGWYELTPKIIDGFFLISGTVLCYGFFLKRKKGLRFNLIHFYIKRYFRLTPALLMAIIYTVTIAIHVSQGPIWTRANAVRINQCVCNWWAGLLHISNYVVPTSVCLTETWYVACDFQLYIIAPLILIPLYKRPSWGMCLLVVCFLLSAVGSVVSAYIKKLSSGYLTRLVFGDRTTDMETDWNYRGMHFRIAPFLMGVALGHKLFEVKQGNTTLTLSRPVVVLGWTLTAATLISLLAATTLLTDHEHEFNPWIDPLFVGLSRILFCAAMAWVIFACALGYGGVVNQFLSFSIYRPLAKLSYAVYLVHINVLIISLYSIQVPIVFNLVDQLHQLPGDIVITYVFAALLYISVEAPISRVVIYLLKDEKAPNPIELDTTQKTPIERRK